jgi:methionyl-tRNA formyltransferase
LRFDGGIKMDNSGPKIVLAGSVTSTRRTLEAMLRNRVNLAGVLGLSAGKSDLVSGYARLDDLTASSKIPYIDFEDINAPEVFEVVKKWEPDILFVVGLSQLVKKELLALPKLGCVGFHPTHLPEGRGRAPLAWLTLENRSGAATFFMMDEGADSGPILAQQTFTVSENDYASDVMEKLEHAIGQALDGWFPHVIAGEWNPLPQDDARANYYGKRAPEDGLIDWSMPANDIMALIRASSRPHPGAYTYMGKHKLVVWRAELEKLLPYHGVTGRILLADDQKGFLIQTGEGLLWLTEVEFIQSPAEKLPRLRVGIKLGYAVEDEIFKLKQLVTALEERLSKLEQNTKSQQNGG